MPSDQVVAALVATGQWSAEQVNLGFRAAFCCEYCDRDLLASVDDYDSWQVDHIVPTSRGGLDVFDNKAIACKTCNASMKRRWDPRTVVGSDADRAALVGAAREHVAGRRLAKQIEIDQVVALVRSTKAAE